MFAKPACWRKNCVTLESASRALGMRGPLFYIGLQASTEANFAPIATGYFRGSSVIKAPIFGVPMPVDRSYPGVVGNRPLLLVV